jgi:hypothetical protein
VIARRDTGCLIICGKSELTLDGKMLFKTYLSFTNKEESIMIRTLYFGLILSLGPMLAISAENNTGYVGITEIKVWPTYIDIYSETEPCVHL